MTKLQETLKVSTRKVDEVRAKDKRGEEISASEYYALVHAKCTAKAAFTQIMNADPKQVFVNEKKRTITVLFDNGEAETVTCAKEDEFNVETGIAMAIATYFSLGKPRFHAIMERLVKKAKVIKK